MKVTELVKSIPVDKLIEEEFNLVRAGRKYLKGVEHDSLVIDLEKNRFYWNSMDIRGDAFDWLTKVRGYSCRDALIKLQEFSGLPFTRVLDNLERPTPIYPRLLDTFYELGKMNRGYWYGRGYTDATIDHFKLGFTGRAFTIPIMVDGELANFQCRAGVGKNKRIWTWARRPPDLFNADKEQAEFKFLTEGAVDTMALHQIGLPAMSGNSINHWNPEWNKYIVGLNRVYILYDNDRAGMLASSRVSRKLLNRGNVLFWPNFCNDKYDVNEALNELGPVNLYHLLFKVMLPAASHSSVVYEAARKGQLYSYIDHIKTSMDKVLRGTR